MDVRRGRLPARLRQNKIKPVEGEMRESCIDWLNESEERVFQLNRGGISRGGYKAEDGGRVKSNMGEIRCLSVSYNIFSSPTFMITPKLLRRVVGVKRNQCCCWWGEQHSPLITPIHRR